MTSGLIRGAPYHENFSQSGKCYQKTPHPDYPESMLTKYVGDMATSVGDEKGKTHDKSVFVTNLFQ